MKKLLIIAYDINPFIGSECKVACFWVRSLAKFFELIIVARERHRFDIEKDEICYSGKYIYVKIPSIYYKINQIFGKQPIVSYLAQVQSGKLHLYRLRWENVLVLLQAILSNGLSHFLNSSANKELDI